MAPQKGNLEAARLCKEMGVPLDIVGKPVDADYVKRMMEYVDDQQIMYHGEVTEEKKIRLMQTCKALIYYIQRPEVTSHKVQEAMLCGAPVITGNIGALPEIIDEFHGILCNNARDYCDAIENIWPHNYRSLPELIKIYSIENVVKGYMPLYQVVAGGLRW